MSTLPKFPVAKLHLLSSSLEARAKSWLKVVHNKIQLEYQDGSKSDIFEVDSIQRERLDAVAVIPHYTDRFGKRFIYLRSCIRPSLGLRSYFACPEDDDAFNQWEIPAGLIEKEELEKGFEGIRSAGARELHEETGFDLTREMHRFIPLGSGATFSSVGLFGERIFFFEVELKEDKQGVAGLDGSILEEKGIVTSVSLLEAMDSINNGIIKDSKTEIAIRRLITKYGL